MSSVIGASINPTSNNFAGPGPFSEPETRTLSAYIRSIDKIELYLSFHSSGQILLLPFGYTTEHLANYHDAVSYFFNIPTNEVTVERHLVDVCCLFNCFKINNALDLFFYINSKWADKLLDGKGLSSPIYISSSKEAVIALPCYMSVITMVLHAFQTETYQKCFQVEKSSYFS